ncbi:MAG: 5-(carboxyamino)imidazole ribonucleotide synthase [Methanosarcinales archaeon]|nr:5-(carboxyamino)imidazole ribonucleotide synthase [Methanosarcinales archaeon]
MKIGIIGGGQLSMMSSKVAKKQGFHITILDPTHRCPASMFANEQIIGNFYDKEKITELVRKSDVTTFDIEHIDVEILKELELEGHKIYPSPKTLEIIQNKLWQNDFLKNKNIPIPKYMKVEDAKSIAYAGKRFGHPIVLKRCKGGYDGKGNFLIRDERQIEDALNVLSNDFGLIVEECIKFDKEIALMVAKDIEGNIKCHPVVESIHKEGVCHKTIAPLDCNNEIHVYAKNIAVNIVKEFEGAGIFGIEMFLIGDEVLVNEIAPRPHNSGHYTIEACETSQFEQHIRAIAGLPLGNTDLKTPAVMINLFGDVPLTSMQELLMVSGVAVHLYGKKIARPGRKMGHITIIDESIEKAIKKAESIEKAILNPLY